MDPKATADLLWRQAYDLVNKRFEMDQADYHRLAVRKSVEIQDFLAEHGVQLEATKEGYDLVTGLGKAFDAVAAGAADTVHEVMPNPLWVGVKTFGTDVAERTAAAASAVGDVASTIGKKLHWIALGLGGLAVGAALLYFGRRK